nr:histidine kinase N-terminal 7TM domain-containing protein [Halovenus carboxidivorans]
MLRAIHLGAFLLAVVGCLLAAWRVRGVSHDGTRRGLTGLFVLSAVWAFGQAVLLANPPLSVAHGSYIVALIAGFGTVWAWLYFCSAYAGQSYHRDGWLRRTATVVFLGIAGLKLTNPVHESYFAVERVTEPFPHAQIELLGLHEVVTVLAYALTAVGFFMLFELFRRSELPKRRLTALVGLTTLPVGLDVLSDLGVTQLVANTYVPLGVAAFGIGALFVAEAGFEQVHWASHRELLDRINQGVIIVDDSGTIRDYNAAARWLFPQLEAGEPLDETVDALTDAASLGRESDDTDIVTVERGTGTIHCLVGRTKLTIGPEMYGQAVMISDVTTVERQRRELKRQSEQLDDFAAAIAHELRNTLTITESNLVLLSDDLKTGATEDGRERVARLQEATERMTTIVDDLNTLARLSQTVTELDSLAFGSVVEETVEATNPELGLTLDGDGEIRADRTRFRELVRNVAMLAGETDTTELRARVEGETIEFAFRTPEPVAVDGLLEYGEAVPHAEAGMLGPNIQTLARAQGWAVRIDERADGFCIALADTAGGTDGRNESGWA